ncbi:Plasmodium exported protein (hyp15), unknown function [Plasmodium sp. gorilla clade G2]|uniref:Plasmodium exported protein (hyp15), unknown function n=1 Tax=Plasmodium sp. gorilla clade G2 TaxID=880535 RepID=UPI000D2CA854|nr:Plasmodium exported protein (hyp15), unknown function [Plasmodium sp. gorilla clade G2]SOV20174.1 Plasmodium exported protein (hyp15), unknown function [Plasmodium sp. gorilla clade G2]
MNFSSLIVFLFIVILNVLLAEKENILTNDLYKHENSSYSNFDKKTSSVKCATKETVYHELSKTDGLYENFVKYNKVENKRDLDKGTSDKKYSKNIFNSTNSEDIFEPVKRGESCDYKNNMMKECYVTFSSKPLLKKNSRMTRFKNKLYKMIFKRNKIWRVISGIITVLGESAIICEILMVIGSIIILCSCSCTSTCVTGGTLIIASGGVLGAIILFIILIIVVVWLLVTWLWSHKDVYYELHKK